MQDIINKVEQQYKKPGVTAVKPGDTVKVTQKIQEGGKERLQVFEGLVIKTKRLNSHTATVTIRRIASGVGVEKTILLHSPLVTKVEVTKRSKVRRNYLTYMRKRSGKSARLSNVGFDDKSVNVADEPTEDTADIKEQENQDDSGQKEQIAAEATDDQQTTEPKQSKTEAEKSEPVEEEAAKKDK